MEQTFYQKTITQRIDQNLLSRIAREFQVSQHGFTIPVCQFTIFWEKIAETK